MVKKILFGLMLLMMFTTVLFAQTVYAVLFQYDGNLSQAQYQNIYPGLLQVASSLRASRTDKLPNEIILEIDRRLRSYTLDVGDVFTFSCGYGFSNFYVSLRITNARNGQWEFYAFQGPRSSY